VAVERLKELYEIKLFYFNPNIHPEEEYSRRLYDVKRLAEIFNLDLLESKYNVDEWLNYTSDYHHQSEGGERCSRCFEFRLGETADRCLRDGIGIFCTSLTLSPHKDASTINRIGCSIAEIRGIRFLQMDFKKRGGFNRSVELSRIYGFYRQSYCGCRFSLYSRNHHRNRPTSTQTE
jgi:predicted adenine nucleotide alpha hydrolase (AANH) superfamily ATPase